VTAPPGKEKGPAVTSGAGNETEIDTGKLPLGRIEIKDEGDPDVVRFTSALAIFIRGLREGLRR